MDIIIPIGVIVYILLSVLGAVLKNLNSAGPDNRAPRPVSSPFPTLEEMFGSDDKEDEDSPDYFGQTPDEVVVEEYTTDSGQVVEEYTEEGYEESREDEQDGFAEEPMVWEVEGETHAAFQGKETSPSTTGRALVRRLSRQRLREAVVMTEILQRPRAKRPWPN